MIRRSWSGRVFQADETIDLKMRIERFQSCQRLVAQKIFITALALVIALASGVSMMALAFRTDFREPAADNGGDWTTWNCLGRITE
jgi:hypothetical protein